MAFSYTAIGDYINQSDYSRAELISIFSEMGFPIPTDEIREEQKKSHVLLSEIPSWLYKSDMYNLQLFIDKNAGRTYGSGVYKAETELIISTDINEGYKFLKWSDENTSIVRNYKMPSKNTQLSVVLSGFTYILTYDKNGANSGVDVEQNQAVYPNALITQNNTWINNISVNFETNGGSEVETMNADRMATSWNTKSDYSGYEYDIGAQFDYKTEGTTKLYVHWKNAQIILPNTVKSGYTLVGWYNQDGTIKYGDAKDIFDFSNDMTAYARWTTNTYTVYYNGNGVSGEMKPTIYSFNESKPLELNTFEKEGYSFQNWNDLSDGTGTSYEDGQIVSNLTEEPNGVVELYAQWTPNQYDVTLNENGGTIH